MKNRKTIALLIALGLLLPGAWFSYKFYRGHREAELERELYKRRKAHWVVLEKTLREEVSKFKGDVGIVVRDLDTKWEIAFDKEKPLPAASLLKVPIMAACFYALEKRKINSGDTLRLKASDIVSGSGVLKNRPPGTTVTIEKLIKYMVSESDNVATNLLINLLGFDYLNAFFKRFGLKNTNLSRKMMDFRYRSQGVENYTTAEDMACILEKIYRRQFLNNSVSRRCLELLTLQRIRDRLPSRLPPDTVIAHKTGLERRILHDAGIVFTPRGDFLLCVLTKNAENSRRAREFIAEVARNVYNYYQASSP